MGAQVHNHGRPRDTRMHRGQIG